ncbi:aminodeoxychorismate lyase [uncultured Alteromonas sp.]|jgi:4-amino-4-deoxychorismate lyase|uniref:aminodeoxychorismate lyase n=1 Tax=uncultured Alteromonas sp. TaxID=179113 RepID=UPI0025ED9011|nr:aminodeoxychorismate lyase [uncultured Alteromonas sp.]
MTDTHGLAPLQQFALNDRLANYGDGTFTTMQVSDGKVALLNRHIDRLVNDSQALGLTVAADAIRKVIVAALAARSDGVLKVLIGAGQGGRGYARLAEPTVNVAVSWHDVPAVYQSWQHQGIHVGTVPVTLARQPLLAGLKHANRLEQVLIKQALVRTDFDDAIVTDTEQNVIEASAANLFWQTGNQWFTSSLALAGVNGVMRQFILDHRPDINIIEQQLTEIAHVDAMFLSNALMQIVPVKTLTLGESRRELAIAPVLSLQSALAAAYAGEYGAA